MNTILEQALAYWRSMAPQPKAIIYADAIEARMKGDDTADMVVNHELENAINRGASIARATSVTSDAAVAEMAETIPDRSQVRKRAKTKRPS